MIHKKSCFGRTFEQDTQASEPEGKSWSDDKFYENIRTKMESKPPEPLWQPQWNKPAVEKLAWWPMSMEEHNRIRDWNNRLCTDPSCSFYVGNTWHSD
jgi:hypothetical protein